MKVVFLGTADFGLPSLAAIAGHPHHRLAGVVTGPDKPRGRGLSTRPTPVGHWAQKAGAEPVYKPVRLSDPEFVTALKGLSADAFAVVAFRILPEQVFTIPRFAFNLHASLLPAYRGPAPIQRAIMAGETETGVTTFLLQKTVDTGALLLQRAASVTPDDTAGTLSARLATMGAGLVIDTLDMLEAGTASPIHQDGSKASMAPKLGPTDQYLDFDRPGRTVIDHVRAMAPQPGVFVRHRGTRLKIVSMKEGSRHLRGARPGDIVLADPRTGIMVASQDQLLSVELIQAPGRRVQSGAEYVRGHFVQVGDRLEPTD